MTGTSHITSPRRRAAFLDRDGVINVDTGYLYRWEDFQFMPGVIETLGQLHRAGYLLVVITNQSGIARGYYSEADFQALTQQMQTYLAEQGCPIAAVYYCPHLPSPSGQVQPFNTDCHCRKPKPGMLLRAAADLDLDLNASFMVGDKLSDMQAATAAGVARGYLLQATKNSTKTIADKEPMTASSHFKSIRNWQDMLLDLL